MSSCVQREVAFIKYLHGYQLKTDRATLFTTVFDVATYKKLSSQNNDPWSPPPLKTVVVLFDDTVVFFPNVTTPEDT